MAHAHAQKHAPGSKNRSRGGHAHIQLLSIVTIAFGAVISPFVG